jgi:excisionase family DNA binding protein
METATQQKEMLLYRVSRAAELLDISRAQLYKMIQKGSVRAVRIGESIRIPADVIRELTASGTGAETR